MKVAFRVDASCVIGSGHVYRCLTLAQRLREEGAECHFLMRAFEGALFGLVDKAGFATHSLPAAPSPSGQCVAAEGHAHWLGVSPATDVADTLAALGAIGRCDWLVVDHYSLDTRWEQKLRGSADRLLVIDDLADRPHDCDVLLDQNLQERPGRYDDLTVPGCKHLLGPRYALLRSEFGAARAAGPRDYFRNPKSVLLFMGGVDLPGLTPRVLEAFERVRTDDSIVHVLVGAGNPLLVEIEREWADRDWVTVHRAPADLLGLMQASDVAVGAGGTATWERCCLGLPSIILSIAANQRPGSVAMSARGAALYAGDSEALDEKALAAAIALLLRNGWLRSSIGAAAAALVDGEGTARVVRAMRSRRVHVRPATEADAEAMLEWRNSEETRRFVRDPALISRDGHFTWFAKVLASANRDLLVGEADGEPVGVVRFDREGDRAEISIFLAPGKGGRGAGSDLLCAGLVWLDDNRPETRFTEAEILEGNVASHRMFVAAGFQPFSRTYRRAKF